MRQRIEGKYSCQLERITVLTLSLALDLFKSKIARIRPPNPSSSFSPTSCMHTTMVSHDAD